MARFLPTNFPPGFRSFLGLHPQRAPGGNLTAPKILLREDEDKSARGRFGARPDFGWSLLSWVGLAFAVVGFTDLALIWYPLALGNVDFEFASVTATLNGLPLGTMGLVFLMASAAAAGAGLRLRVIGFALLALAAIVLVLGVLWATNVPIALKAVPAPALTGLKKALVKSSVQLVVYPVAYVILGVTAVRRSFAP